MGSIWDPPFASPTVPSAAERETLGSTPTVDPASHLIGQGDGPLFTSQGRGVRNGVPYGETLADSEAEVAAMHWLRPGTYSRFRAETRAALGR